MDIFILQKNVLLKSVAMAIPVFAMSCFKLPKTTCKNLTSAMANFWWNAQDGKNKMHWVSLEKMCLDKKDGGLGFRDLEKFNQALLANQGWRILMFPDSLCSRVLRSRYFPNGSFIGENLGPRPSYAWRSILFGRELFEKGLRRSIGSGNNMNVWRDKWLFDTAPKAPMRKPVLFDLDLHVSDLINPQTLTWDRGRLEHNFFPQDIELIIKHKPVAEEDESFEWVHTRWGAYSVKSGYWLACRLDRSEVRRECMAQPSIHGVTEKVSLVKTAPKIRIFLWKALSDALSVNDGLRSRGMKIDPRCQRCGNEGESINHVLFTCHFARRVWAQSGFPFPSRGFENRSLLENFNYLLNPPTSLKVPEEIALLFPWILWVLWKNRNSFIFEGKDFSAEDTVRKAMEDSKEWFDAQKMEQSVRDTFKISNESPVRWEAPRRGFHKCNVGLSWSKKKKLLGASWIVRNDEGVCLLHSRRAFENVSVFWMQNF